MRRTILLSLGLGAVLAACGPAPMEPATPQAIATQPLTDTQAPDTTTTTQRGGNLMGSGH